MIKAFQVNFWEKMNEKCVKDEILIYNKIY